MSDLTNKLSILMADTYALYLKTQNYHWHVQGPQFKSLHELFESQYKALAEAVDQIAERLRIKGQMAPATFKALDGLKTIQDGDSSLSANDMVAQLAHDHGFVVKDLNASMTLAQSHHDEATVNLLADRLEAHEKARWMLEASLERK